MGIAALGQELTAYGYALYDLDGMRLLAGIAPKGGNVSLEEKCRKYGQYAVNSNDPVRFGMKQVP